MRRLTSLTAALLLSTSALADTTPFDLSSGNFSQDWTDASLITTDDDWTGVPSITGFRGDGMASTGADPQTVLQEDPINMLDVNANEVNPDTFGTGGNAEFDAIANPVVAFQGSGTADAPYLQIYLNTTGRQDIQISYDLRDIDASTADAIQQVALHYRVGTTGVFTNVGGGYVPDASTVNTATQVTPISLTLPAAVNDQAEVHLRIMTANASGVDEFIGVDNITITSAPLVVGPGVSVTPDMGLSTHEAGGSTQFSVVLNTMPTADVTLDLSSDDVTEGSLSMSSLTFTTTNWDVPQSVTITGVDDAVADGNVNFQVVLDPLVSTDPAYSGLNPADLTISNLDDESLNLLLTPTGGLVTSESGTTATFTIRTASFTAIDVTVDFTSTDTGEGTVTASVNLPSGAPSPQTVTVTGIDDALMDGDVTFGITGIASSFDAGYNNMTTATVFVTNRDDDLPPGISITPTSGLSTSEAGGTETFDVVLQTMPTADVTIPLDSNDLSEGTVSATSLTFTAANWDTPQTVTVTGVDDDVDDGDVAYAIVTAVATSTDPDYSGLDADDVSITNTDDDSVGIVFNNVMILTSESGTTDTFTIALASEPTADVTIPVSSQDTTEGTLAPASVTFTSANWDTPQTITVTGVDDAIVDGDITYVIASGTPVSADPNYVAIGATMDIMPINQDNDVAGVGVSVAGGGQTDEGGTTESVDLVLNTQPSADVSIALSSDDTSEGTVSPASVTFTMANWDTPQTVTVTGVDDAVVDGNQPYNLVISPAVSSDGNYNGVDPQDVALVNLDNDQAQIVIADASITETDGGSVQVTFSATLDTDVAGGVQVSYATMDDTAVAPDDYTAVSGTFVFAGAAGEVQSVVVDIVGDLNIEGDEQFLMTFGVPSNPNVSVTNGGTAAITIIDNELAGGPQAIPALQPVWMLLMGLLLAVLGGSQLLRRP